MPNKTTHPAKSKKPAAPMHLENSTDATRGEPLAVRAEKRKIELQAILDKLPEDLLRERADLQLALSSVDELMTGDLEHLPDVVASELNTWLERTKHLAESAVKARTRSH
jgi:hypothetical protein